MRCLDLNRDDEIGSNPLPIFGVATKLDVPIYSQVGLRAGRCPKVAHTADNRRYQVDAILAYETAVMRDLTQSSILRVRVHFRNDTDQYRIRSISSRSTF